MRYDKKFYLCGEEELVFRIKDGPWKGLTDPTPRPPKREGKMEEVAELIAEMVEKDYGLERDYCLVQAMWDNGSWLVAAMMDCTDVERVERVS